MIDVSISQMLMIRLEESDCFASWVLGDKTGLPNADADIKGDCHFT